MTTHGDKKRALVIGTMDTKQEEIRYLCSRLEELGLGAEIVDSTPAQWMTLEEGRSSRDEVMRLAAARIAEHVQALAAQGQADGVVAIGGASGAALAAPALQSLPLGFPKVLVSPVASGDTAPYVDTSDVVLIPPIVDFVGLNAYAQRALDSAAVTLAALIERYQPYPDAGASTLAATAFGVTSPLVSLLHERLKAEGLRQAVFVCNGTGGRAYERFVAEGRVFGAFDVTTSELADELFGGVLSAGPARLTTAARLGVPQVVLPGAMDFINFGPVETVPEVFRDRPIIRHTPQVTLVRTSPEENERLAQTMAQRLRAGGGSLTIVVPLRGFSKVSEPGRPFYDPKADRAFLDTLVRELGSDPIITVDAPLNSDEVAAAVLKASEPWRRARR
ncbi:MAG TPA: Tm-1-like ATP-binding domain-containing protein [Limnochordia bacterium]|nr:Tm-1-like ATP-binding domain-containing protein [Limnochordia bacterium]